MLFNGLFRPAQPLSASDFDPTQTHGAISEPVMEVPLTALKVFVPSQTR